MIEGISNSQTGSPGTGSASPITGEAMSFNAEKTVQKGSDSKSYELLFSEEAWEILGSKKLKEESDKAKKEGNSEENEKTERDLSGKEKLSDEDQRKVKELEKIDRNVKVHEQAHLSAAGGYARGGANYNYVTGPDGKKYANAGHVNLDTGKEKDPEATIRKASVIRRAALAPADPSPSDRKIAADAIKMEQEAQIELAEQRRAERENGNSDKPADKSVNKPEIDMEQKISENREHNISTNEVSSLSSGTTAA